MNEENRMSKADFAKMMQERRKALFDMANDQVEKAVESSQQYKIYLDLHSRLGYTPTNTLLVMKQNPKATLLKDIVHWREEQKYIKKGEKGIQILEPGNEYVTKNGNRKISYNPKYVFDISQISGLNNPPTPATYETSELVSALLYRADVQPEVVTDDSKLPSKVYFDLESNKIYVKAGQTQAELLHGLIREYCVVEFSNKDRDRQQTMFLSESCAYMISNKFGLENRNTLFLNDCNEHFFSKEPKEIKRELEQMKKVFSKISNRVEQGLYAQQEQTKQKNRTGKKKNREKKSRKEGKGCESAEILGAGSGSRCGSHSANLGSCDIGRFIVKGHCRYASCITDHRISGIRDTKQ